MEETASVPEKRACFRENLKLHQEVFIVTKRDQRTGILTRGKIRWILTSKEFHSRGIKVMLEDRSVGRVQKIIDENGLSEGG